MREAQSSLLGALVAFRRWLAQGGGRAIEQRFQGFHRYGRKPLLARDREHDATRAAERAGGDRADGEIAIGPRKSHDAQRRANALLRVEIEIGLAAGLKAANVAILGTRGQRRE